VYSKVGSMGLSMENTMIGALCSSRRLNELLRPQGVNTGPG
jgi:hypothetical protein